MHRLSKRFNTIPGIGLPQPGRRDLTNIRPHLDPQVYIHHVTGMYRRRDLLIPQICDLLRADWEREVPERPSPQAS